MQIVYFTEDKDMLGDKANPGDMLRRNRVFANDIENIPLHTAILWGAFIVQCFSNMSGHGEVETKMLTVLICLYSFFRLTHTLCYANSIQPYRSISFMMANFVVMFTCAVLVKSSFNVDTDKF